MKPILILIFLFIHALEVSAQNNPFPLYEGAIPNSKPVENLEQSGRKPGDVWFTTNVSIPMMTRFDPADSIKNGTAIVICPGGGYWGVADDHEGTQVAKAFNSLGVTAFVLKYRMPSGRTMIDSSMGPFQDAQQAIRVVRRNAAKWGLKRNRIGIIGFSAGGHLAATAGTHFDIKADPTETDTTSVRPDFMALIYPVISFKNNLTHVGSRTKLVGAEPKSDQILYFSNEEHITFQTPPTFLVHAEDDYTVLVDNSIAFYRACTRKVIPVEMHLYPKGGHGFGLDNKTTKDKWMERLANWLQSIP